MARPSPSGMFDPEVIEELRSQFNAADKDGDGEINAFEACILFARCSSPDASPEELRKTSESLRQQLDTDKSGKISFDEYCFRFGRKQQMERNKRRRAGAAPGGGAFSLAPGWATAPAATGVESNDAAGSSAGPQSNGTAGGSGPAADREAKRREKIAAVELAEEREALRRERDALERERQQMREDAERRQQQAPPASATAPSSAQPSTPPPQQQQLPPGSRVLLQNLRGAAELNGRTARVLRFEAASSRYVVELDGGGGQKSLRSENLKLQSQGSGGGGAGAAGAAGAASGPSFAQKAKVSMQNTVSQVGVWMAGYAWWQLALGAAVVVLFLSAYVQLGNRYPSTGGASRRGGSSGGGGWNSERPDTSDHTGGDYGEEEMRSERPDTGRRTGGDWGQEEMRQEGGFEDRGDHRGERAERPRRSSRGGGRRGGYDQYDDDYDDGYGGGGGGGGGLLGMLSGGSAMQWYLIVGGLAFLCWRGIIPVHRMSWFQLYMLWSFVEPLLMGGRRGRRGGGMMGGMMGGMGRGGMMGGMGRGMF